MTWWAQGSEKAGLDALIEVFNQQHPDVEFVNAALTGGAGSQAKQKLQADLQAGNPPDSFQAHTGAELQDYIDADGTVDASKPTELWITCRMIHAFSLGTMLGRPGCAPLVDHGLRALRETFADAEHGGWFAAVDAGGPVQQRKEAYPHAFVLLAASSALAAGRPGARDLLQEAQRISLTHFWEEEPGMVVEGWDRTFTDCEDDRGVNANMHTVEAYLAVADVTGQDEWLERALRITERVVDGYAREAHWRLPEHFDSQWQPLPDHNRDQPAHPFRPYGATIGHWFEWARLTLHARAALEARGRTPGEWMLEAARALVDTGIAAWSVDGAEGFVYTTDFDGTPVVRERMHWVICEAIGAAAARPPPAQRRPRPRRRPPPRLEACPCCA